jgi:microsomal prostaglandin-E synthase 2
MGSAVSRHRSVITCRAAKATNNFPLLTTALGGSLLAYYFGNEIPGSRAFAEAPGPAPAAHTEPVADHYQLPTTARGLPRTIVLYQYEVCPFCNKVRAFLDYHKIPYRTIEVNPLTKAELKWSDYRKVPVILLDDKEQVNDSTAIISRLAAELSLAPNGEAATRSSTAKRSWWARSRASSASSSPRRDEEEETKWRRWVDERLVRVITVNIYRNAHESFQTFDYITKHGNFGWAEREAARVFGAGMMWGISKRLRKKYGVEGDVREALYECAAQWVEAVGPERPFLGGSSPNLADLAVFGVMRSVVGTDTFMDLQHNTEIGPWWERMMEVVGPSARIDDGVASEH